MSEPFSFDFALTVERLTGPAREGADALSKMVRQLKAAALGVDTLDSAIAKSGSRLAQLARDIAAIKGTDLFRVSKGFTEISRASSKAQRDTGMEMRKIADEWQRLADKAEKAEQRKTAALEREGARRQKAAQREAATAERLAERLAKKAAREAEKASRSPWFGGYKSMGELFGETAKSKMTSLTGGLASSVLGAPASLGMGAIGLAGDALSFGADLASSAAEAAVSFGKMAISAQAMREQSVEGFKAIYGSSEKAEMLFDNAVRIAKLTKFDTPEVIQHFNDLAAGGFGADEMTTVFAAIADVQSARGAGKAGRYSNALQKMNAQPTALFSTFQQAAMAGPGLKLAEKVLADQLGLKDRSNIDATLRKMFKDKKIGGTAAIDAILGATSERYDQGGKLGGYARKQGEGTWEGLISNIRNGLSDVLTMKLPDGHPMLRLKDVLREINSLFDSDTKNGQRFNELIKNVLNDVFKILEIDSGGGGIMDNLLTAAELAETKFKALAEWLNSNITKPIADALRTGNYEKLASQAGQVVVDLSFMAGKAFVSGVWGAMKAVAPALASKLFEGAKGAPGFLASLNKKIWIDTPIQYMLQANAAIQGKTGLNLLGVGKDQAAGVAQGMKEATPQVASQAEQIAAVTEEAMRRKTETHSPSRMFARIGEGWGDGLSLGIESRRGAVQTSMTSIVPSASGGGNVFNIYIDGTGKSNADLVDELLSALMSRIGGQVRTPSAATIS